MKQISELEEELIFAEEMLAYYEVSLKGSHWFGADGDRAMVARYKKRVEGIRELLKLKK